MPFSFRKKKTKNVDLHILLSREEAEQLKQLAIARDMTVSAEARFLLRKSLRTEASEPSTA